jgi:hypothetical protein
LNVTPPRQQVPPWIVDRAAPSRSFTIRTERSKAGVSKQIFPEVVDDLRTIPAAAKVLPISLFERAA